MAAENNRWIQGESSENGDVIHILNEIKYGDDVVTKDGSFFVVDENGNLIGLMPKGGGTFDGQVIFGGGVVFQDVVGLPVGKLMSFGSVGSFHCTAEGLVTISGKQGLVVNDPSGSFQYIQAQGIRLAGSTQNDLWVTGGITLLRGGAQYIGLRADGGVSVTNYSGSQHTSIIASNVPSSSERYKENIQEMTDEEADQILQFVPVSFDWKKDSGFSGPSFSFIAERLAEVDERFIYRNSKGDVEGILTNPVISAQNKVIKRHESEITALRKENAALKALLVEKGILTQEEIAGLRE